MKVYCFLILLFLTQSFSAQVKDFKVSKYNEKEVIVLSGLTMVDTFSLSFFKSNIKKIQESSTKKTVLFVDFPQDYIFENCSFENVFELYENINDFKQYSIFVDSLLSIKDTNLIVIGRFPEIGFPISMSNLHSIFNKYPNLFDLDQIKLLDYKVSNLWRGNDLFYTLQESIVEMYKNIDKSKFVSNVDYLYVKSVIGKLAFDLNFLESEISCYISDLECNVVILNINPFDDHIIRNLEKYVYYTKYKHIILDLPEIYFLRNGKVKQKKNKHYLSDQKYIFNWYKGKFELFSEKFENVEVIFKNN